jgi:hypothetical protein
MTVTIPIAPATPTAPDVPTAPRRADDAVTDDAFALALDRARPREQEQSDDRPDVRARRTGTRTPRSEGRGEAAARDVEAETAERPESDSDRVRPRVATDDSGGVSATAASSGATLVAVALPRAALDLFQRIVGTAIDAAGANTTPASEAPATDLSELVAATPVAGAPGDTANGHASAGTIAESLTAPGMITPNASTGATPAGPMGGEGLTLADDLGRAVALDTAPRVDRTLESRTAALAAPDGVAESVVRAAITPDLLPQAEASLVAGVEAGPIEIGVEVVAAAVEAGGTPDSVADTDVLTAARASTLTGEAARRADAPFAAHAANSTSTASSVRQPAAAEQVVNVLVPLRLRGDGNYEVRLELKPPELGRVEIRVEMRDGVLHAHLRAEQPAAAMALRDSLTQLRDHLAGHGVHAGTLDVDTNGAGGRRHRLDLGGDRGDAHTETTGADRSGAEGNARSPRPTRRDNNTTNRLDVHA